MQAFIVIIALTVFVHSGSVSVRRVRQSGGWPSPITPGWSTSPPTTAGWSTQPPTTAGWGTPPSILTNTNLNAALAAVGSGWAAENHAENVQVKGVGAGGWGPNAEILISVGGDSAVEQDGSILQVTDQDSENVSSLNLLSVSQIAAANEGENLGAFGLQISNAQSGWATAAGEGASAADAASSINVSQVAANLGIFKP